MAEPISGGLSQLGSPLDGRNRLRHCSLQLSARSLRRLPPQLFLLRSQLVLLHAAAGIHGADLSPSRSSFEAFVRMFPRIVLRFSGVACRDPGIVVVRKK